MDTLRHHFVHHKKHMLGCIVGALVALAGDLAHEPALVIAGTVVCAGSCFLMIRMIVAKH